MKSFPFWMKKNPQPRGILTPFQQRILEKFFSLKDSSAFFLTGGTALAEFYLGHRKSYDFDLFTHQENLVLPFSKILEQSFKKEFEVKLIRRLNSFAELMIKKDGEEIKLQLAYDAPFRFLPPIKLKKIILNDYLDLVIDKISAFYGRCEYRDVADLYFILIQPKADFWQLEKLAREKDPGFDLYFFAQVLHKVQNFPDDLKDWPLEMLKPFNPKKVKSFFKSLAKEIEKKLIAQK